MPTYNGHPNWNAWNTSLWLHNDEGLYRLMQHYTAQERTKDHAARAILRDLQDMGQVCTPDGAPYTFTNIRRALRHQ